MIRKLSVFIALLVLSIFPAFSQSKKYDQSLQSIAKRLKTDDSILASDSLEGREAGTKGETMARDYISTQFKDMGLKALFNDNSIYVQPFDVNGGATYAINSLEINKNMFNFKEDFYPMDFSANGSIKGELVKVGYGISAAELNYDSYKNLGDIKDKIVVIELNLPDSLKKIQAFEKYYNPVVRSNTAIDKGAKGIIFVNSNPNTNKPPMILSGNAKLITVPTIFADNKAAKLIKVADHMNAEMEVNVNRKKCNTAYNIGGYIDNKAKYTVVFGAHYDHLGYTTSSTGKKIVYNGADDNGSGTSALLELARYFTDTTITRYNFIFLAFSAEEKGLLGSKYFVESNAIDLSKVAFMINCDMVGRLDSIKRALTIYSVGSSPAWKKIISETDSCGLKIIKKNDVESGSDHYSFYEKNIPDVFFFTELHADYHKPTDDVWKINFLGEAMIVKYIERFFNKVKGDKKLPFERASITW